MRCSGSRRTNRHCDFCASSFSRCSPGNGASHRMISMGMRVMCSSIAIPARATTRQLSALPLLDALDDASLVALEREFKELVLPGGRTLFSENEVADALYVVLAGSLGVMARGTDGRDMLIARIQGGETVGEMALLDADCDRRQSKRYATRSSYGSTECHMNASSKNTQN
jgi:Cyclic nucleotide-binding domain